MPFDFQLCFEFESRKKNLNFKFFLQKFLEAPRYKINYSVMYKENKNKMEIDEGEFDHAELNLRLRRLESFKVAPGPSWKSEECSVSEIREQLQKASSRLLFPGETICAAYGDIMDGKGTRIKCGWLVSKVMGKVRYYRATKQYKSKFAPFPMYSATNTIVEVHPLKNEYSVMPSDGEKVAAMVTYVSERFIKCRITHNYEGIPFQRPFYHGTIKAEDAGYSIDTNLFDKFKPGLTVFGTFRSERSHGGFCLRHCPDFLNSQQ